MEKLSTQYQDNVQRMDITLGAGRNCDIVARDYLIGGRKARIWVVDGFGQDAILERMGALWLSLTPQEIGTVSQMEDFILRFISFSEVSATERVDDIIKTVREQYPTIHITAAVSNISFQLPVRKILNLGFTVLAMNAGLDSAILDPTNRDMMGVIFATEALLGLDDYCMEYISAYREGLFGPKKD